MIRTINPATGQAISTYKTYPLQKCLTTAKMSSQTSWGTTSMTDRLHYVSSFSKVLAQHKKRYATLMTQEMGKPIAQSTKEVEKCIWLCDILTSQGKDWLEDEPVLTEHKSYLRFDPLGTILGVMPWNFPFWQVVRCALPAIVAGNTFILKHASQVTGCALALHDAFNEAFPPHVFTTVLAEYPAIASMIRSPHVHGVSFTGSTDAGKSLYKLAGEVTKPCVLELGGSDPFIVLEDADIPRAAAVGVDARMQNTGQSCIAAKRFIVVKDVADAFTTHMIERIAHLKVGDPMDPSTQVGPLASDAQVERLERQLADAKKKGARLSLGPRVPEEGAFVAPGLLTKITPNMLVWTEEVFGPIASVMVVKDEREAIKVANDTPYGLGASLWTTAERGERLSRHIQAGTIMVNGMVKSDPRVPFGGIKGSGIGKELGKEGIRQFTVQKAVVIEE